jgi:hypothetical protein
VIQRKNNLSESTFQIGKTNDHKGKNEERGDLLIRKAAAVADFRLALKFL